MVAATLRRFHLLRANAISSFTLIFSISRDALRAFLILRLSISGLCARCSPPLLLLMIFPQTAAADDD